MVHTITRFIVEFIGVITVLKISLLIIDRRGVSIMSILFANRRVTHLGSMMHLRGYGLSENILDSTENVSGKIEIVQGVFCRMVVNRINK